MGLVLCIITSIMYALTERYNEYDYFENSFVDSLVRILHIITFILLLYTIASYGYIILSIICGYILIKNIKWLFGHYNSNDDEEEEEDQDQDKTDENSNKENNVVEEADDINKKER